MQLLRSNQVRVVRMNLSRVIGVGGVSSQWDCTLLKIVKFHFGAALFNWVRNKKWSHNTKKNTDLT